MSQPEKQDLLKEKCTKVDGEHNYKNYGKKAFMFLTFKFK